MNDPHDKSQAMATTSPASATAALDPAQWVEAYGDGLFKHALARVGQRPVAEDLVQEAFLAAWKARNRFAAKSSEKTWLLQILRHKIADHFRQQARANEIPVGEELERIEEEHFRTEGFSRGKWRKAMAPKSWGNPDQSLEQKEFWRTLHECVAKLPEKAAQAFLMREVDELDSEEICRTASIQSSHLFVLLHRARLALRRCLELNWFRNQDRLTRKPN